MLSVNRTTIRDFLVTSTETTRRLRLMAQETMTKVVPECLSSSEQRQVPGMLLLGLVAWQLSDGSRNQPSKPRAKESDAEARAPWWGKCHSVGRTYESLCSGALRLIKLLITAGFNYKEKN